MSDPLYRREILRLAADAHGAGRLASAESTGVAFNPACGDKVTIDLIARNGAVVELAQETIACVLAQASASILGRNAIGATREAIEQLRNRILAMLEAKATAPDHPFESFAHFSGAVEYASRHRCVLLPIEALLAAFDELEG